MSKFLIYLSDIHANIEALEQLHKLPEMRSKDTEFRFGGDYSDSFTLTPKATLQTWNFIKKLCDSGKAKAILGNHDDFVIKAVFQPFTHNSWFENGLQSTIENLGITYANPQDFREQMLFYFYEQMQWLKSLPTYLQDGDNILVHAGFDLDLALEDQLYDTMLWAREFYINGAKNLQPTDIHSDFQNKTIISGHTPTIHFAHTDHCPILFDDQPVKRYFIDGGSGSDLPTARINLLKLDEHGNEIWKKYATADGIFDY